jgi:hypothetical protein
VIELLAGGGVEVLAARDRRHVLQRALVQPHAHRPAAEDHDVALGRAEADGVDAHAQVRGELGRLERIDPDGVLPVAQQHDDGAAVRAGRDVRHRGHAVVQVQHRRAPACVRNRVDVDAGVRKHGGQRVDQAGADGRARLQCEAVDRLGDVLAVARRRLHHVRIAAVGDHGDAHVLRQPRDEGLGRLLRGGESVRVHVARLHAARDVHRQHHRLLLRQQRQHGGGPRGTHDARDDAGQQQRGRHPASPARRIGVGRAHQRQVRMPDEPALAPALHQPARDEEQRQEGEAPQDLAGQERHTASEAMRGRSAYVVAAADRRKALMAVLWRALSARRQRL